MNGEDYEAAKPVPAKTYPYGDPWVTAHLPECALAPGACLAPGPHQEADGFCWKCHSHCICNRLRACEQRVREETAEDRDNVRDEAYAHGFNAGREHGEKRGFVRGVQAARDAVAAVRPWSLGVVKIDRDDALAAIDALKEDK